MTTLNGHPLLAMALVIPRTGSWVLDALIDGDAALEGAVVLDLAGRTWRGTVFRGGVTEGRWSGRVVGGAGGLARTLGPASMRSTTLAAVLAEALRDAGESAAASTADLTHTVERWHRHEAPALHTVAEVARRAGYTWRVLPDGTVWMGVDAWGPLALPADVDVLAEDAAAGSHELAGDGALDIAPGRTVTLDGRAVRVGAVEHRLTGHELRTSVREERAGDPFQRLTGAVEAIVRRVMRETGLHALYPAKVIGQRPDGTLDLQPDDPRIAAPQSVPYRTLPGVRLVVPAGTRVLLGYENGDPQRPVAQLWELGDVTRLVVAGGTHEAARKGHATINGTLSGAAVPDPPAPAPPVTSTLRLTYTPPGGAPQVLTITGLPPGVTVTGSHDFEGVIDEGTDVLHLP